MTLRHASAAVAAFSLCLSACATANEALKPYPAAADGYQRHVIELPPRDNEADYRVELIAGRTQMVDCNVHRLGGAWQEKTLDGWGYPYFELTPVGPGVSTMMACPESSRREAFVRAGGEPLLVGYNSKLPVVIYAPAELEVRYRLWSAESEEHQTASQ